VTGVREAETWVKLRFLSRYRLLAWLPILRRAFFLPTTEVNSVPTLHRIAGVLRPMTVPAPAPLQQLQTAMLSVMMDGPTTRMKPSARQSFPAVVVAVVPVAVAVAVVAVDVAVAVAVDVVVVAAAAVTKTPQSLGGNPLGAWVMLLAGPRSPRRGPSLGTTPDRSAGVNAPSVAPVADWTDRRCARKAAIGTGGKNWEVVLAAEALGLSASVATPLLLEQAS
jgi:hypothetical protein